MNFYKRYMGDFARDTAHLTMIQTGAYDRLLDHYYATKQPLPTATKDLYVIAKAMTKPERAAVDFVASSFFPVGTDGRRHNKRADREIAESLQYAQEQADRAHKRWRKQAHMPTDMPTHMPPHMPTHMPEASVGNANHSHSNSKSKEAADAAFWRIGVQVLTNANIPEQTARAFLGKHYKNDRVKLAEVISYLATHPALDPKSYIEKAMRPPEKRVAL